MPCVSVSPVRLGPTVAAHGSAASVVYAVVSASCAGLDAGGVTNVPTSVHGAGNPTIALPGLTPTFPVIVDAPAQVTVVPARTAKGVRLAPRNPWARAGEGRVSKRSATPISTHGRCRGIAASLHRG